MSAHGPPASRSPGPASLGAKGKAVGASIHVLIVDDSAVARESLSMILRREPGIRVTVAADPMLAVARMASDRPDVILLDLVMPKKHGLTFLREIVETDPIPVVICSSQAGTGADVVLRALDAGAVAVVAKPRIEGSTFAPDSVAQIVEAVRSAAGAWIKGRRPASSQRTQDAPAVPLMAPPADPTQWIIALGASAGGTEALRVVLANMPPRSPGIVMVQHMPEGYTTAFAASLDRAGAIRVREARDGDRITPGTALLAPGNQHMTVLGSPTTGFRVKVEKGAFVTRHRPSVDVLFRSIAMVAGSHAVGVVLTGMGDDGAEGLLQMHKVGAITLAQDEATSVVYGMPREAVARGGADESVPLSQIAARALVRIRAAERA